MFTVNDLRNLLNAQPFVPFRLILCDGGTVEVRSREVVMPGRDFAFIGLLDPDAVDTVFDRWTIVGYTHVTRVEFLRPGPPPVTPPSGPAEAPTPSRT